MYVPYSVHGWDDEVKDGGEEEDGVAVFFSSDCRLELGPPLWRVSSRRGASPSTIFCQHLALRQHNHLPIAMPSVAIKAARNSPLPRHHQLSSLCWSCAIGRNARLSSTSSSKSTSTSANRPPPKRKTPSQLQTSINDYHAGQKTQLSGLINAHRNRAAHHQLGSDARPVFTNASGARSFHASTAVHQQAAGVNYSGSEANPDFGSTREFLIKWQKEHGIPNRDILDELGLEAYPGAPTGPGNLVKSGLPVEDEVNNENPEEQEESQDMAALSEGIEHVFGTLHFTPGDLVEIL